MRSICRPLIAVALAACVRKPVVLTKHHTLEPAVAAQSPSHRVRVQRVSGYLPFEREIGLLWVELELHNEDVLPWQIAVADLAINGVRAVEIATRPTLLANANAGATAIDVEPKSTRIVWARFERLPANQSMAEDALVAPRKLELRIAQVGAEPLSVTLSDPERSAPIWTPPPQPYFATMAFGTGVAGAEYRHGAITFDVSFSTHRRFGELDVGLLGSARVGLGSHAGLAVMYGFWGLGPTVGYTLTGDHMYGRGSLHALTGWASEMELVTNMEGITRPVLLGGELQLGSVRRSLYPVRQRKTGWTLAWYLRCDTQVGAFSERSAPFDISISGGVIARGGS